MSMGKMNMMELSPIAARRAVWIAQTDLFLDTDVRLHYAHLAYVAANSPFSLAELESIFRDEVAPVFEYNLMDIAGEWAMFADDDVIESVEGYLAKHLVLSGKDCVEVGRRITCMARWVHHEAAIDRVSRNGGNDKGCWNSVRVLGIVFGTAMFKGDLLHQSASVPIE